mmetsp:Transcript_25972/g.44307  ORF Transcript_25972/g.44307 Transcript_25972/m.44307 type:complete len:335 (+) Transcript_25972:3-1007(+)
MAEETPSSSSSSSDPAVAVSADELDNAKPFAQRAYHPDAVLRSNGQLEVDVGWYLTQQILPPIARLCEPIEGTSTALLAERLGLDGSKFNRGLGLGAEESSSVHDLCDYVPACEQADAERFQGTSPLAVRCRKCAVSSSFKGAVVLSSSSASPASSSSGAAKKPTQQPTSGFFCPEPGCRAEFWGHPNPPSCFSAFSNLLAMRVRSEKAKYYESWLVCDDSACQARTQQLSVIGDVCLVRGCAGRLKACFSDKHLHTQLKALESAFDVEGCFKKNPELAKSAPGLQVEHREVAGLLKKQMECELKRSGYDVVPSSFWAAAFEGGAAGLLGGGKK